MCQNVDTAIRIDGLGDHIMDMQAVGNVGMHKRHLCPRGSELFREGFTGSLVRISQQQSCAFLRKAAGASSADTACGTSNNHGTLGHYFLLATLATLFFFKAILLS